MGIVMEALTRSVLTEQNGGYARHQDTQLEGLLHGYLGDEKRSNGGDEEDGQMVHPQYKPDHYFRYPKLAGVTENRA